MELFTFWLKVSPLWPRWSKVQTMKVTLVGVRLYMLTLPKSYIGGMCIRSALRLSLTFDDFFWTHDDAWQSANFPLYLFCIRLIVLIILSLLLWSFSVYYYYFIFSQVANIELFFMHQAQEVFVCATEEWKYLSFIYPGNFCVTRALIFFGSSTRLYPCAFHWSKHNYFW